MIFEKYLYTEEDNLLDNVDKIGFGYETENGLTVVENTDKIKWMCTMDEVNAIMFTIAALTNQNHLCTFMSGNYLGLQIILNGDELVDWKKEIWKVLSSPKISVKKISHLKAYELVPILVSLNEHRELWKEGEEQDASKYFKND